MPHFSVVIAAYKAAGTLAAAVDSALEQTLSPLEVIVVDDCSPDDQAAVVARYGDRVRVIRRDVNGGEAAAKNTGAYAAIGEYVALLDADDSWMPERLARIADILADDPDLDLVTTDAVIIQDGTELRRYYGGPTGATWAGVDQRHDILDRNFIFSHAVVRRTRWLDVGGMTENRVFHDDWQLWVRLILTGSRAALVGEPLVRYHYVPGSSSDSKVKLTRTWQAVADAALALDTLTVQERAFAERQRAAALRELEQLRLAVGVYEGAPDRRGLSRLAADSRYRKRDRAFAALAAIAPSLARRRMDHHPDRPGRV